MIKTFFTYLEYEGPEGLDIQAAVFNLEDHPDIVQQALQCHFSFFFRNPEHLSFCKEHLKIIEIPEQRPQESEELGKIDDFLMKYFNEDYVDYFWENCLTMNFAFEFHVAAAK